MEMGRSSLAILGAFLIERAYGGRRILDNSLFLAVWCGIGAPFLKYRRDVNQPNIFPILINN